MIVFLIILLVIILLILYAIYKVKKFLKENFNSSSLKTIIKETELEEETREKTLYGMESIYLPLILKDFKELNINELKSIVENNIISCFKCINERNVNSLKTNSEKVKAWLNQRIDSLKENDNYSDIKIHRTVLNKYEKNGTIASLVFQTSFEYKLNNKKKQSRIQTEFIYIIDSEKQNGKAIGLNCPNCGAPIKILGDKQCEFCGALVLDIVKRVWSLNNIKEI